MRTGTEKERRPRGRPRSFDPQQAAERIVATFWDHGFAATSLDQLAAATELNRPSLYAAFGDKKAMYRASLAIVAQSMQEEVAAALRAPTLAGALRRFYKGAIQHYTSGDDGPRGCLHVCTATVDAVHDPEIRSDIDGVMREIDTVLAARIARAQAEGEIPPERDPAALAAVAGAVLHSLAVRARAGQPRRQLEAIAATTTALIVGTAA